MARMRRRDVRLTVAVVVAIAAAALFAANGRASPQSPTAPVPSLEPAATEKLWDRLVQHPQPKRFAADCRPLRGVFWASTDWLRLATKLAQFASPCAQYYVSVPPLVSDKTKLRAGEAAKIRALGSNFHALAEIHYATWSRWVASTGSTWFAAGQEARRRMVEAGFDVSKGDTWAVNEFPSTVRTGAGPARGNARELVRGLYEGDGTRPAQGVVFIIGVSQFATDVSLYQNNLQNWMNDSAFWQDMTKYVSDWSQEVYPDIRNYAVPGAPLPTRRDFLIDYLEHEIVLARVAPPTIEPARTYVQNAYSPLANAAWQWDFGYGWTMVPFDVMQSFVSAQVYALRYFSATTGQAQDHWGFAWAPRNATGIAPADFGRQTASVLDRLGTAIRDSAETKTSDPGSGACGPPGQNLSCGSDVEGATFITLWQSFRTWTQPTLIFATPPQTLPAGAASGPISLALLNASGAPQAATTPITITLTTSSPKGQFSTSPTGPWTPTLTLTMAAGSSTAGPFYYVDTQAGPEMITAAAFGVVSAAQTESILPGPPVSLAVTPATASIRARATQTFDANGTDSFGNTFPVAATWTVTPTTLGGITPGPGTSTSFTAGAGAGTGTVTATATGASGTLTAAASVTVTPGTLRIRYLRYGIGTDSILVSLRVVDSAGRPVKDVQVRVLVRRRGYPYFSGSATTAANGLVIYRLRSKPGCYRTTVTRVVAAGYRWDRQFPDKRFCK